MFRQEKPIQPIPATPAHHRFVFLDGLRGVAALLVFFWHTPPSFHLQGNGQIFLAVDFFFCLSGFVIAFAYERRLAESLRVRDYLVARLIRLYPMYLCGIVLGAVPALVAYTSVARIRSMPFAFAQDMLLQLLVLPALHGVFSLYTFPLNFPSWSMFFELLVNAAYGCLAPLRIFRTPVLLAIILAVAFTFYRKSHDWRNFDHGAFATMGHWFAVGLLRVILSFCCGILLLRLWRHAKLPHVRGAAGGAAAVLITGTLIAALAAGVLSLRTMRGNLELTLVVFPALIFAGAHVNLPASWNPLCEWLGGISYPFYLLHASALALCSIGPGGMWLASHHAYQLPAVLLALLLALVVSTVAADKDVTLRKRLTSAYRKRQAGHAAS